MDINKNLDKFSYDPSDPTDAEWCEKPMSDYWKSVLENVEKNLEKEEDTEKSQEKECRN